MGDSPGRLYTASYITSALSTVGGHDILTMISTAVTKVRLRALDIWAISTAIDPLGIEVFRSSSLTTSGGAAITPQPVAAHSGHPASNVGVTANSSTLLSTANASCVLTGAITQDGYHYRPDKLHDCIEIGSAPQRLHVRTTTPTTGVSRLAVCATFQETGDIPGL